MNLDDFVKRKCDHQSVYATQRTNLSDRLLKGVVVIVSSHGQCTSVITSRNRVEACGVEQSAFDNLGPPTIYMWGRLGPPPASPSLLDSLQGLVSCQVEFEEREKNIRIMLVVAMVVDGLIQ